MAFGCILVPVDQWLTVHDALVTFRSELSKRHSFRMRSELKATHLIPRNGKGPWRKTSVTTRSRHGIFRAALTQLDALAPAVRTLGVVVPDRQHTKLRESAVEDCWNKLLERLERFCSAEKSHCILMPDDGNPLTVRRIARKRRRFAYAPSAYAGGMSQSVPFGRLVDDPLPRDSQHSYLMQWADLVAHAAFRRVMPRPGVPEHLWENLGASLLGEANRVERRKRDCNEPEGLIVWPDRRIT
jgi:hypothetical protein